MFKKNDNIILRTIHGSIFLIDISDNYSGDNCALYEINEIGMFIWNHINECRDCEVLVKLLQEVIVDDVPYEILNADIQKYIDVLKSKKFVCEVTSIG